MAFLTEDQLSRMGFKNLGRNVKISDKASFYKPESISVGDNSRIDDYCVLSAGNEIIIGRNVHISVFASIIGRGKVRVGDFSALSGRVSIYSSNDDYSGYYMTNPTVDSKYTNVENKDVNIGKHVIVGSGSIILPGITLEDGVSVGSLSLVKENCKGFSIYGGIPARFIKKRSKKLLEKEQKLLEIGSQ